jgi:hypothetical protein
MLMPTQQTASSLLVATLLSTILFSFGRTSVALCEEDGKKESSRHESSTNGHSPMPNSIREVLVSNSATMDPIWLKVSETHDYAVPNLPRPIGSVSTLYFQAGKMWYSNQLRFPSDVLQSEEWSFDGKVFYTGSAAAPNGKLTVIGKWLGENLDDPRAERRPTGFPYLEAVGFSLPRTIAAWKSALFESEIVHLTSPASAHLTIEPGEVLKLRFQIPEPAHLNAQTVDLDQMAQDMKRNGATAETVASAVDRFKRLRSEEAPRRVEMWLDPKLGYALIYRVDSTFEGKRIRTIDCSDFKFTGRASLWLPQKCVIKIYVKNMMQLFGFTDVPTETRTFGLEQVSFEPRADVTFALDCQPGTAIFDRSVVAARTAPSGQLNYIAPSTNVALRDSARGVRTTWRSGLVIGNVLFLIVLCALAWWRWRSH